MQANWISEDIPDLTGKVIIITGANSGIGYETAKQLARKNAHIVLACRNLDLASTARDHILHDTPRALTEIIHLDLANLATIREFANQFGKEYNRLDVLINNAGTMMGPYVKTVDGFERQFGTNHLGHFAITGLLLHFLLVTPASRVVNVSSTGHWFGQMDFDNLLYEGGVGYSPARAYSRSKLANLLFTYELQRRYVVKGVNAIAVAAHPGVAHTNLTRHMAGQWFLKLTRSLQEKLLPSAEMGALPILRAAVDPEVKGGEYYGPDGLAEQYGFPVVVQSSQASHNVDDARKLWEISKQLTGVVFDGLD